MQKYTDPILFARKVWRKVDGDSLIEVTARIESIAGQKPSFSVTHSETSKRGGGSAGMVTPEYIAQHFGDVPELVNALKWRGIHTDKAGNPAELRGPVGPWYYVENSLYHRRNGDVEALKRNIVYGALKSDFNHDPMRGTDERFLLWLSYRLAPMMEAFTRDMDSLFGKDWRLFPLGMRRDSLDAEATIERGDIPGTIEAFAAKHALTLEGREYGFKRYGEMPPIGGLKPTLEAAVRFNEWGEKSRHFAMTLKGPNGQYNFIWSNGGAFGKPSLAEVLAHMKRECADVEPYHSAHAFAREVGADLGYSQQQSIKLWKALQEQRGGLVRVLGLQAYGELLEDTYSE